MEDYSMKRTLPEKRLSAHSVQLAFLTRALMAEQMKAAKKKQNHA